LTIIGLWAPPFWSQTGSSWSRTSLKTNCLCDPVNRR